MAENNLNPEEKTLDDVASEAFDEIINRDSEPEEVEEAEEETLDLEETEPEEEAEPEEPEETAEEPEEPEEDEEPEEEPEVYEAAELDPSLVNPPTTWRPGAKAEWDAVSPTIKAEIHKREQDALNGVNNLKEKAQYADRLDSTISPYKAFLTSKNLPPEAAIADALNLAYTLETSTPQQRGVVLQNLARHFKADMSVLQKQIDPKEQQFYDLQQEIHNLKREQANNSQSSVKQQNEQVHSEVANFANQTDEKGRLSHPYFENVKPLMASLIESGAASGLDDAYEMAVKAHPDTSALVATQQSSVAKAQRQEAAKKKAEKAKRNGKVNLDSTPVDNSTQKPKRTIDETLAIEAERIGIT